MPYIYMGENSDLVHIKTSKITNAGDGLFTLKKINEGDFICWYIGCYVDKAMVINGYYDSDYLFTCRGGKLVIDAADPLSCFGRYANDSLSKRKTNCKFVTYENSFAAALIATKNIRKGAEVYVTYGSVFWLEPHRFNKLSASDKAFVENYDNEEIY